MYKHSLAVLAVAAAVSGCSTFENPADYLTFRNEPLVKQVDHGMTQEQVRTIGGPPSSDVRNSVTGGTCNNYVLNVDGLEQPYYVDFDVNGRVDSKGFMTCEQHQGNQRRVLVGPDAKFLDKVVRFFGAWYQPMTTFFAKKTMLG